MAVIPYGFSGQRPARARPGRFGGAGVAAMAASSAAASASCGRGSAAAGTAGGDGAVTVVTVSVTTRAASGSLSDGDIGPLARRACRALSHSMAAIRSASARRKAAPSLCWLSSAANASTAAISSGHSRTCTGSFTILSSRPGGGAIPHAFSQCYHVDQTVSRVAPHVHACNAMRGRLRPDSYAKRFCGAVLAGSGSGRRFGLTHARTGSILVKYTCSRMSREAAATGVPPCKGSKRRL
jgi:hypothetical protein